MKTPAPKTNIIPYDSKNNKFSSFLYVDMKKTATKKELLKKYIQYARDNGASDYIIDMFILEYK